MFFEPFTALRTTQVTIERSQATAVWLYDTTLRDGAQTDGISLSIADKLTIARHLDQLGIPFIEGGWPGANLKDSEFFAILKEFPLSNAQIVPFCSTRRPGKPEDCPRTFAPILDANTQWVTLFGKSWDLQVTDALRTSLSENLAMITDSIRYLRQHERRVIYDAEHWFDGYKANPDYALATLHAAIAAGAEWLVLCDTNGGTLPDEIGSITEAVTQALAIQPNGNLNGPKIGIHAHNDAGTAVANSLSALKSGAQMIQGTINGYGERCGNANLCTLIPNLVLKLNIPCLTEQNLAQLTHTSKLISEVVNLAPDVQAPYVGQSAFAHKGGIHVSAIRRNALTYEHVRPEAIGNHQRVVISEQAGLSNILEKANAYGFAIPPEDPVGRTILARVKALEQQGFQFDAAEASFELIIRDCLKLRPTFFDVLGFEVHCRQQDQAPSTAAYALATIKVLVREQNILMAAEGEGPVNALDQSLRKALSQFYPTISQYKLSDYKVRILDSDSGTSAKIRVLIEFSHGLNRWKTIGVSSNIIEASYQALIDGLEYGLIQDCEQGDLVEACPNFNWDRRARA